MIMMEVHLFLIVVIRNWGDKFISSRIGNPVCLKLFPECVCKQPHQLKTLSLQKLPMRVCLSVNEITTPPDGWQVTYLYLKPKYKTYQRGAEQSQNQSPRFLNFLFASPPTLSSVPSPSQFLRKKLFCIPCSCVFLSYCLKLNYNACMEYKEDITCE